jgi:hypothetical protein
MKLFLQAIIYVIGPEAVPSQLHHMYGLYEEKQIGAFVMGCGKSVFMSSNGETNRTNAGERRNIQLALVAFHMLF